MSKKDLPSSLLAGLVLALILVLMVINGNLDLNPLSIRAQTDAASIIQLMLTSHTKWSTLAGEAITTWHLHNGETQHVTSEFAVSNSWMSRFEMPAEGFVWINDSQTVYGIDNNNLTYFKFEQPEIENELSLLPSSLDEMVKGEVYRHPLAMSASSPVVDYIFPVGLAQRAGDYTVVGEDELLGRKTWVISYQLINQDGAITINCKYWVDQELGLILKAEVFSTDSDRFGKLSEEMVVVKLFIDAEILEGAFTPALEGYEEVDPK